MHAGFRVSGFGFRVLDTTMKQNTDLGDVGLAGDPREPWSKHALLQSTLPKLPNRKPNVLNAFLCLNTEACWSYQRCFLAFCSELLAPNAHAASSATACFWLGFRG